MLRLSSARVWTVLGLVAALSALPLARASAQVRIPADFERHPALLVGASQMLFHHPEVLLEIASSLQGSAEVLGLVGSQRQARALRQTLAANGLAKDAVTPVVVPMQTMWVRDYGPVFLEDAAGEVTLLDARYGGTERNPDDEDVPSELAALWKTSLQSTEMWLEGGQILSNGRGLLLVSTALFTRNAMEDGIDGAEATARLQRALPFESARVVRPLKGERTGHLDIFMAFLDVDLLLVARLDAKADPGNAARLDEHAATLKGTPTAAGPLRILRVDQPSAEDGTWRSYTNTAMAGDVVLVPSYPDVDAHFDAEAMALYRRVYPDREIVPVDARSLVEKRGALHCVSMPVPSMEQAD